MILHNDFSTSVKRAFNEIDPLWEKKEGLVICGTHAPKKNRCEYLIDLLTLARVAKVPTLGICAGYQLMAIEYARNVLRIKEATSEEWDMEGEFVVEKLDKPMIGLIEGESYWNYYAVRPDIAEKMEQDVFTAHYSGVQYHPEYNSRKNNHHPLLVKFLKQCTIISGR